jgi:DNA-binding MarR family transcriptional regulator
VKTTARQAAPKIEDPGRRAWRILTELIPLLKSHWTASAADFDLTPAQAFAMKRLEPGKPVPMNSLTEVLMCDASNVTGIVDKLEARGLIERRASAEDRRVKHLVVTPRGAELRQKLIERTCEPHPAFDRLSAEDQCCLGDILERLLQRF